MTKAITMKDCMTPMPHTIGINLPLARAIEMMDEFNIRHLPVLECGKICGMISDRDINLAQKFDDHENLKVEDVMNGVVFTVKEDTLAIDTVHELARQKLGSAVVLDNDGNVAGIFTVIDGLRLLEQVLDVVSVIDADPMETVSTSLSETESA